MPVSETPAQRAKGRPTYHHGDLYGTLLKAASALMVETKSWDFSLRELARRAGVSHNAPYNHFADKQALLTALAADGFDQLSACMTQAAAGCVTPGDAFLSIGLAYVRFGLSHPQHYRLMFGSCFKSLGEPPPANIVTAAAAAKGVLHRASRLALGRDDQAALDITVLTAWSLVHGLTLLFLDGLAGEPPSDMVIAAVLQRSLTGLPP